MLKFPIVAFEENIIFNTQGKAFAIYKIEPQPYNFLTVDRQQVAVSILEELLTSFTGKGQIFLLWEELEMNANSYFERNTKTNHTVLLKEMERHTRSVKSAITDGARVLHRFLLFELPLNMSLTSIQELMQYSRDTILKTMMAVRPALPSRLKTRAEVAEQEMYGRLLKYSVQRATFKDIDFIIRKTSQRIGTLAPSLPDRKGGIVHRAMIASFTDGNLIKESLNYVTVTDGKGKKHYQAFIHLVDYPLQLPPYGSNVFNTNNLAFPFDAVIHINVLSPHEAKAKVDTKKRLLAAQVEEALVSGEDFGIGEETGLTSSRTLAAKLESGKSLASLAICLAVSHEDKQQLNSRVAQLQATFTSRNYRAVRPAAKQLESLVSFLPGSEPAAPSVECDPGFIAAMGPTFAFEVGDPTGFFLGWSGQTPAYWQPGRAAKELNKTNAILISGSLGGGKSVLSKNLAYFTLLNGGYVLAIDPKEEYWPFKLIFPDIVNIVDLSPRGGIALNPFLFSETQITAQSIAQNFLSIALHASGKEYRLIAISQALEMLFQKPREERHMEEYIRCLMQIAKEVKLPPAIKEEAELCVYSLQAIKKTDVGQMVFGTDNIHFFGEKERMVVINIKEIPRPSATTDPSRYTESERQGLALIYLISAIAREAAFGLPRNDVKMLLFDEAWVIASTSEGERLLEEIIRIGRSYNLIPVLISQNITDLEKPVFINNAGQVFCFRAMSADETKACLRILGADENSVKTETFAKLGAGVCLFRDSENRIGWLKVDVRPSYLIEKIFNSKPDAQIS